MQNQVAEVLEDEAWVDAFLQENKRRLNKSYMALTSALEEEVGEKREKMQLHLFSLIFQPASPSPAHPSIHPSIYPSIYLSIFSYFPPYFPKPASPSNSPILLLRVFPSHRLGVPCLSGSIFVPFCRKEGGGGIKSRHHRCLHQHCLR